MLENICNNQLYTTDVASVPEQDWYTETEDEHILDIIECEEEKIQELIDRYLEEGGY